MSSEEEAFIGWPTGNRLTFVELPETECPEQILALRRELAELRRNSFSVALKHPDRIVGAWELVQLEHDGRMRAEVGLEDLQISHGVARAIGGIVDGRPELSCVLGRPPAVVNWSMVDLTVGAAREWAARSRRQALAGEITTWQQLHM